MRIRPVLLAALAAAAVAGTVPAEAAANPVCAAHLELAAAGTSNSCSTVPLAYLGAGSQRIATIEVASGAVDAQLRCGASYSAVYHVSGPRPVNFILNEANRSCYLTITATENDTTAVGTSEFFWGIYGA
jgi:hypothetical protein